MSHYEPPPLEIHVHGDIPLQPQVGIKDIENALRPLWEYAGAASFSEGAQSYHDEEPGIVLDAQTHTLHMCWTVCGNTDFHNTVQDMCMNLNEIASAGAPIEISFYDTRFGDRDDEDDHGRHDDAAEDDEAATPLDNFMVVFVGPNPAAIMQIQRDLLVRDVTAIMERHFDSSELGPVVLAIDQLFMHRFNDLVQSLTLNPDKAAFPGESSSTPRHGIPRNKRHLH